MKCVPSTDFWANGTRFYFDRASEKLIDQQNYDKAKSTTALLVWRKKSEGFAFKCTAAGKKRDLRVKW